MLIDWSECDKLFSGLFCCDRASTQKRISADTSSPGGEDERDVMGLTDFQNT